MKEIGRIIRIEREKLLLALESEAACASCDVDKGKEAAVGCQSCSLFGSGKPRTLDAVNRKGLSLSVGDRVVVYLDPKKTVLAAFLLFIFPLLAFLTCYILVTLIVSQPAESVKILAGAAGFVAAYLFLFLRRTIRKMKDWPEVIDKYESGRNGAS
jgi:positive regulator of sigma E activity